MKNYKIRELKINGNIASGLVRGLIYITESLLTLHQQKKSQRKQLEKRLNITTKKIGE